MTIWDFSVEVDEQELQSQQQNLDTNGMEIPPQLMFLHQGQQNMKELRYHPEHRNLLFTTSEDSFNVFRPNFDPDFDAEEETGADGEKNIKMGTDYVQDSDEDQEAEERRVMDTVK